MYKTGRLENHVPSVYDEGAYSYPDRLQPRQDELDWENQDNPRNEECHICLANNFDPKRSIVLPCKHQYCAGCIIEWQKGKLERGGNKQADECPTCLQRMPVVEQSLMERADKLLQKAKESKKKRALTKKIVESKDENDADETTRKELCEDALELTEKSLQSRSCQRTNHITKAEILLEMGRNLEAANTIHDLLQLHYKITKDPLVKNCFRYEQAMYDEQNEEKMDELMQTMTQQLQGMDRLSVPPFIMINDAYTIQARALMADQAWGAAIDITQSKLLDFTWKLMADTPWIANGEFQAKVAKRNLEYMMNLGIAHYNLGDYDEALYPLSCAVMMNRQSKMEFGSYRYFALSLKGLGDWEEVLKVITMAALYQPHCASLGQETFMFYKEMLQDWYNDHRNVETPPCVYQKVDFLLH
jgi:tetratricopeptide (TPR) repeat protein